MKKLILSAIILCLFSATSYCLKIDGKFRDWSGIPIFCSVPDRLLEKDRSGIEMSTVKMTLTRDYLYIYIDGFSVAGQKIDRGWGAKKTSFRISFKSAQSPLNRVRISAEPSRPGLIKVAYPPAISREYGSKADRYWWIGRNGRKYAFEIKIPVFHSSKGDHIGSKGGPLLRLSQKYTSSRQHLSDALINSVDVKTHRLVDTVEFPVKKGDF